MKVKSRVQLRKNAKNKLLKDLVSTFGDTMAGLESTKFWKKLPLMNMSVILVDGKPLLFEIEGQFFPTVRGALEWNLISAL